MWKLCHQINWGSNTFSNKTLVQGGIHKSVSGNSFLFFFSEYFALIANCDSMAISISDGTYVAVAINSSTVALADTIAIVITASIDVALTLTIAIAVSVSVAVAISIAVAFKFSSEVGECYDHMRSLYLLCFRR